MKTKQYFTGLVMVIATFFFTSCGPLIFKANFDADAVGNAPNPNPPGDPSGDVISGNCGIVVVNSSVFDSKAMRFFNEPGCLINLMWFQSESVATSNNFLNYTFSGYPESTSHRKFTISFAAGHFRLAFSITYDGGTMYLTDGSYTNHNIGTYSSNQKQTFLVGINRTTNAYALTISQDGGNVQLNDRPVKEPDFWGQSNYLLYLFYDSNDTSSSANGYVLDNVTMNKEKLD